MTLDMQTKTLDIPDPTKKPSVNQYGSVDSGNAPTVQIPSFERSKTPLLTDFMDPTMCYTPGYYPYYYGGYDGTGSDWDNYPRYVNSDGVDITSGVYGENGSLMYHHGYGYPSYGPYSPAGSPIPTMGSDGQLYGPQQYQYPPYFQPLTPSSGQHTPRLAAPSQGELSTSTAADQKPLPVETANPKSSYDSAPLKSTYQNSLNSNNSYGRGALPWGISVSGYQDPRFGFDVLSSLIPWLDGTMFPDGQHRPVTSTAITSSFSKANNVLSSRNQNFRPNSQFMGLHHPGPISGMGTAHGYTNRMHPNKLYGQYGNALRSGLAYGSNVYDSRTYGRGWSAVDGKPKLNRGPRAKGTKNQKGSAPITLAVEGEVSTPDEEVDLDIPFSVSDIKDKYKDATLLPKWKAFQTIIFLEWDDGLHDSRKIAAFDFDGCLAKTSVNKVGPDAWSLMYPSIPVKLQSLYNDGYKLVIFTNESNIERWKNTRQVAVDSKIGRLNNFIKHVKVPIQVFIACGLSNSVIKAEDPFRKPKPGMWRIMEKHFNSGISIDMDQSFYVGDAAGRDNDHSDADSKFAEAIELKFYVPEDYFGA